MPGRKVGRGPSKPLKARASKPVKAKASKPIKIKPEKVKPVKVKPLKVKPVNVAPTPRFVTPPFPLSKTAPVPLKPALKPPSKTPLTLSHRVEAAPRKSASSRWLKTSSPLPSLGSSSKPSSLLNPLVHYPPISSRSPGLSSTSKLKSSKSVPGFKSVRDDGKSSGFLKSSKSSQTLKKPSGGLSKFDRPPVPPSIFKSKSSSNLRQDPRLIQPPSSSKIKPIQPAVRGKGELVKKPDFFSRLFGISKPNTSKHPEALKLPQPPKIVKKQASAPQLAPSNITKPNATTTVTPVVKPGHVSKPSPVGIPGSTHGRLEARPVKNKEPIRHIGKAADYRDRTHLVRPSGPKHELAVDYGRQDHDYDTTYTHAYSDYDLGYSTSTYYSAEQTTSYAYGSYSDTTTVQDSGYQPVDNSAMYTPCTVCNVNHQYVDPNTGQVWPYCSDVCQAAANPQPQRALCTVCQTNPQHVDTNTGKVYAYCSQECRAAEAASQQAQYSQPQQATATCNYPGCTLSAALYPAGTSWNYCGQSHEYYALNGCINCRQAEQSGVNPLCKACDDTLSQYAPVLVQVPSDNKIFWDMTDQFTAQWLHPTGCPTVHAVYRVIGSQQSWSMYNSYRNQLEYYGQFAARGKHIRNECLLWHGTRRVCNLGDPGNTALCTNPGCALCSIICGSFDVSKVATNTNWARFGAGIYTSSVSSKANDYSSNLCPSNYKVMLLNNVAVGKAYETYHNKPTLVRPPHGCDSVYGRVGGSLKFDEVVVYTNDAIRPSWLVLYG